MRKIGSICVLIVAFVAAGCAGKVKPNGKILKGGQPLTVGEKGVIGLAFFSTTDDPPKMYNATTKPDGTFTIVGPENKGIPPGKYKVQLTVQDPYTGPGSVEKFGGKYATAANSPLTVDVGKGEVIVNVD